MSGKGVSHWAIIIVLTFFVIDLIVAYWPRDVRDDDYAGPKYLRFLHQIKKQMVDLSEKARIEKWITDNRLNQYGDDADVFYMGRDAVI